MDKKTKFILLGVVVLLGIGIFIYSQKSVLPPSLLEPEEEVALPEDKDVPVDEEVKEEIEKVREKIRLEEGLELASCLIFEKEEYCQKGEIYEREGDVRVYDPEKGELVFIRKETYRDLIFSLPAGIKVYSPMAGFVQGQEFGIDPVTGETMNIVDLLVPPDKDGRKFIFLGLKLDSALIRELGERVEVKTGQLLGEIAGKNLKHLIDLPKHDFTLKIGVTKGDFKTHDQALAENDARRAVEVIESDNTILGKFFPYYLE